MIGAALWCVDLWIRSAALEGQCKNGEDGPDEAESGHDEAEAHHLHVVSSQTADEVDDRQLREEHNKNGE